MFNVKTLSIYLSLALAVLGATSDAAQTTLSVNFQFDPIHIIPSDNSNAAGVVPSTFWNNSDAGGLTSAVLNDGTTHNIGVSFNADAQHSQIASPSNNDERLMGGSFDLHGGTVNLTVSGLPDDFTDGGYDVYVFLWGNDNPNQQGLYETDLQLGQDDPGPVFHQQTIALFEGFDNSGQSVTSGLAGPANYVKIANVGQGQDSFQVDITNIDGLTPEAWTVINGFQVVAVPEPGTSMWIAFGASALLCRRHRIATQ